MREIPAESNSECSRSIILKIPERTGAERPMPTGKKSGRALDPPVDSLEASPDERLGLVAASQQENRQVGSTMAMSDV